MKPFKRMIVLLVIVSGIVVFWLIPGINKAKDSSYTRVYEDTDKKFENVKRRDTPGLKSLNTSRETTIGQTKKIYKKESIHSHDKLSDIKPSMFSRAIQFREELDTIEIDSFDVIQLVGVDTVNQIQ